MLGVSLGCDRNVQHVPWPTLEAEVQTIVVGLRRGTAPLELSAHAPDELPTLELDDTTSLLLLGYPFPIAQIGAGPLDPSAVGPGCELSFPRQVLRFNSAADEFVMSALEPSERTLLDGGRGCLHCLEFTELRVPLGGGHATLGLRLPSGNALVGITSEDTSTNVLLSVGRDGRVHKLTGCEGPRYSSGAADALGAWWLTSSSGRLDRVEISEADRSCRVTLSTRTPDLAEVGQGNLTQLSMGEHEGAPEILVSSTTGRLEAFTERAGWSLLAHLPPRPGDQSQYTEASHLTPNEAIMSVGGDQIVRWRRGEAVRVEAIRLEVPIDPFQPPWISALAPAPTGFWVGDSQGRVYHALANGNLERVPIPTELGFVGFVQTRSRGLVALTEGGRVLQVNDGGQGCTEVYTMRGSFRSVPRAAFVEADGSMFVADSINVGGPAVAAWLWPR